ncbi:alanine--tRNA ligase [Pacificimonas flava]|uniref:Alanine--tRNA ligase n=2 Tax=Pacificimonas TaxID=1960290 RepID=A0A219B852_9SPHN|nr:MULTISPECIES: alanine--tRNA ligase [Pacificimonas]MBZ6379918.1 alanine--tRNA ligase [Pacificimonas aurantium]OWV34441.1 alanine--tRNA ligase [Pacificimonas flava]
MTATNDIRRSFLDYFASDAHEIVPSAPLVPQNDPTLMFVNAGMVPFKDVFTGRETRGYSRATSAQKCVRAGGKHNDLENVGFTARHHTFFEMLGNFSFGDYFKAQAIEHAWTLITKEWGIPAERLTATVFHTDDEAFDLWRKISGLPEERIIRIAGSDNFWSMGDTGPCGPCSELFYDHGDHIPGGPPGSPDEDGDRFVEIWNLVFMQYDQKAGGTRIDLPSPSIDTGMGLERISAVLQGTHDNFDIDLFRALIDHAADLVKTPRDGEFKQSLRVIADHVRSSGFLISDGVLPANEGRGYVLRRILRRAIRHAHLAGADKAVLYKIVPTLVSEMGAAYPELVRAQSLIEATLEQEEQRFRQTLDRGLRLLDEATSGLGTGDTLPGDTAFKLYDTYGFPYDLTVDALRPRGIGVNREGFEAGMAEQKARARAAWAGSGSAAEDTLWFDIAEREGATEFTGYTIHDSDGKVVAIVKDGAEVESASAGDEVEIVANQTPFYGESGGQTGDSGTIEGEGLKIEVSSTSKPLGRLHVHRAKIVEGSIAVGDTARFHVDAERRTRIRANHSATHLLHAALRRALGDHVTQKGSLVTEDRLRFDFSHPSALTAEEIAEVEADVNAQIRGNEEVVTRLMTHEDAIAAGAMALFGEKYGDEVRVLSMGRHSDADYSVELCGGTHVRALGDIGLFKIVSEGAVASGVRRVEALTGEDARRYLSQQEDRLKSVASALKTSPADVPERIVSLVEERKRLEKELAEAKKKLALGGGGSGAAAEDIGGVQFQGQVLEGFEPKALREAANDAVQQIGSGIIAFATSFEGKASVIVGVSEDLQDSYDAAALVRQGVEAVGGKGGGGRGGFAQGGGPDGDKVSSAIDAIRSSIAEATAQAA